MMLQTIRDSALFDNSLKLKHILSGFEKFGASAPPDGRVIKLPKIDVPVFDGNILHWKSFGEQFSVAVHTHSDISESEKLVYLRHSVKDRSARNAIEGLCRTGDNYNEALE